MQLGGKLGCGCALTIIVSYHCVLLHAGGLFGTPQGTGGLGGGLTGMYRSSRADRLLTVLCTGLVFTMECLSTVYVMT